MAVNLNELLGEVSSGDALEAIAKTHKLTEKQKEYVREYVRNGGNRQKAVLFAGYKSEDRVMIEDKSDKSDAAVASRKAVAVQASILMRNDKIKAAIEEYGSIYKNERRSEIENDVFRIARVRATYDPRRLVDSFVGYSPEEIAEKIKALPEEDALCIDGIDFQYYGKDANKFVAKIRFADRDKSVAHLSKLTGMLVEKKEVTNIGDKAPQINIQVLNQ